MDPEHSSDEEELETFPETRDEVYLSHGDHGLPLDYNISEEIQLSNNVTWKDVGKVEETKATVGVALEMAWDHAQLEFEFIHQKLEDRCGSRKPSLGTIVDLIFGEDSEIFHVFKSENIFDAHDVFLDFLAIFLLSCSCQMSTKQLFSRYSPVNVKDFMSEEQYKERWARIGVACLPSVAERNKSETPTGLETFWLKVEGAFNKYSRELFLAGFDMPLQLTIDDDKAHFNGSGYNAGLKTVRHTQDNRNGNTCHTLVHSYSQIVVQIAWERTLNDSAENATQRCFGGGITPMAAPGATGGDLRNVYTAKDRGY